MPPPFLTPAKLRNQAAALDSRSLLPGKRVALLSARATGWLTDFLKQASRLAGIDLAVFDAPFDQIAQQLLDPQAATYTFEPEAVVVLPCLEKMRRQFYQLPRAEQETFAQTELAQVEAWCQQLARHSQAQLVIATLEEPWDGVYGQLGTHTPAAFPYQIRAFNYQLSQLAQTQPQLALFDLAALAALYGLNQVRAPGLYANASLPFSPDFEAVLAQALARQLSAHFGRLNKCLVLDLDGLLWGGTIGDDGLEGIQLGGQGLGKAFADFQLWLKQLKNRGILLVVCSKNEPATARLPFENHPEMVLSLDDIALFVANWQPKAENLRHIQQQLGLGLDSLVFLDDQPGEREAIRQFLPAVTVPELPADPAA
jgi:HAD superfamily phosphatase (TIGR01681 family)